MQVQDLRVHPGRATLAQRAQSVDDLRWYSGQRVLTQFGRLPSDRGGAAGELRFVGPRDCDQGDGVCEFVRVATNVSAGESASR